MRKLRLRQQMRSPGGLQDQYLVQKQRERLTASRQTNRDLGVARERMWRDKSGGCFALGGMEEGRRQQKPSSPQERVLSLLLVVVVVCVCVCILNPRESCQRKSKGPWVWAEGM